jgi:hypothetical protein
MLRSAFVLNIALSEAASIGEGQLPARAHPAPARSLSGSFHSAGRCLDALFL